MLCTTGGGACPIPVLWPAVPGGGRSVHGPAQGGALPPLVASVVVVGPELGEPHAHACHGGGAAFGAEVEVVVVLDLPGGRDAGLSVGERELDPKGCAKRQRISRFEEDAARRNVSGDAIHETKDMRLHQDREYFVQAGPVAAVGGSGWQARTSVSSGEHHCLVVGR